MHPDSSSTPEAQLTEAYLTLLNQEKGWTKTVRQFEAANQNTPGARELFASVHDLETAGRHARAWRWTIRGVWLSCIIVAGAIAAIAFQRGTQVQVAETDMQKAVTAQQVAETAKQEAEKKQKTVENQLKEARTQKEIAENKIQGLLAENQRLKDVRPAPPPPEVLLASLSVRPAQALGNHAGVTVDVKGVFHAKDLVELGVTSPKAGFATLLWLNPKEPRIFPEPSGPLPQTEKEWRVRAGQGNRFPGSLPPLRGSQFLVMVVITPEPSTPQIRNAINAMPLRDEHFISDAAQIKKRLTEALLGAGRSWVAFGTVTLAPQRQMK